MQNYSETKMIEHLEYGPEQEHKEAVASINSKPNYVFIQVESMDANIVRHEYGGSYEMPNLKSLAENNIYYPYTLSYHKGGGTSDAEFSIINSVEPLDSFPAIKLTAYKHPNSYVGKLAGAYYTTMAFHGNVGTFYNRNIAFSKMGFKKFYDISSMDYKDEGWGAPDDKVFSYAFKKISQTRKPFMSYIITMTSHGPFESARHYYNNSRYDSIKEETVKNYFNSMSYVDKSISDFVKNIRQSQPNTYIFIVGDHTPNINTPDYFQASFIDGETYFEFVPLIIITPDNKKYTETKRVASFLDISPSIMDSSGISFKIKSSGSNLLDKDQNMLNIPLKGKLYDRAWLFDRVSTAKYNKEEPLWKKYLPSFIKSDLIEKHNRTAR
jgi:phosphoglycerol transferase MdoB-like AlkP superfamily enzyme